VAEFRFGAIVLVCMAVCLDSFIASIFQPLVVHFLFVAWPPVLHRVDMAEFGPSRREHGFRMQHKTPTMETVSAWSRKRKTMSHVEYAVNTCVLAQKWPRLLMRIRELEHDLSTNLRSHVKQEAAAPAAAAAAAAAGAAGAAVGEPDAGDMAEWEAQQQQQQEHDQEQQQFALYAGYVVIDLVVGEIEEAD